MANSTQGQTVQLDAETALGVAAGSPLSIRCNEAPQGPKDTRVLLPVSVVGYHPGKTEDPISYEAGREGSLTLAVDVRGGSSATAVPPIAQILESGGCQRSIAAGDTTLDGYTTTTAFSLTADRAAVCEAGLIELDSGVHWPVLPATYTAGADFDVTPTFALPSASSSGKAWSRIHSIVPGYSAVDADKTLSVIHRTRQAQTTDQTAYVYSGCALAAPLDIAGSYGAPITVSASLHVADVAESDSAIAVETFGDGAAKILCAGANYQVAFCDSSLSSIAASGNTVNVESWSVSLGASAVPIMGAGDASALNGWQGYMSSYTPARVSLTLLWSRLYSDDVEAGLFADKYFHAIVGGTTGKPVFGIFVPNMHLVEFPAPVLDGAYYKVSLVYEATVPGYGSETGLTDTGAAPWVLALGVAP